MANPFDSGETAQALEADPRDEAQDRAAKEILETARARLTLAEEAETEIRRLALEDLEFRAGKQWPDKIQADRESDGRPCLVINRLPQFVQQITNDQRQNQPAIKVHPLDNQATAETGKIIQGLIRHIEYNSNAEVAYDTAFESAVTGGFGYFRILTEFSDPESFDQEIVIKRIRNPFSVFFDPYAQEPDGSDASWAFIVDDLSPEDYKAKYPDSKLASVESDWRAIGNDLPEWVRSDSARVAEYFYKETTEATIHQLATGETVRDEELEARQGAAATAGLDGRVVRSRRTKIPVIRWVKLNGIEILEETEWLGIYIPIIPVYGAELYVNGKRILEGVIRNAKDPQRMYNYWASAETEAIALAPRTPFLVAEGQIEGYEEQWATANKRNHAYLPYKATSVAGQMAPPPQRQQFEPAVQAITNARMIAADDLKSTTGIYDSALGAQGNEVSGVAIQRRNTQTQTSNFHFVDNIKRSLRHAGRILVDLIPKIYDTARAARIVGDDGTQSVVQLNAPTEKDGKTVLYDLAQGRYDVTIDVGPSYASKRQEAVASMLEISKTNPAISQFAGDLIVKSMDWPGADAIAERLKKLLPPGLADDPKDGKTPVPPQVQAQLQQMGQMIDGLTKHLNAANQALEQKQIERNMLEMEIASKERVKLAEIQADIEINMAKLGSGESMALLKHQVAELMQREKLAGAGLPIQADMAEDFASSPDGGSAAGMGEGAIAPTGGSSPGSPMEGN